MESSYQSDSNLSTVRHPRARCIIEFNEGDVNRPPVVYALGGSDEIDTVMCDAILKRWERGGDER
jgi:hypothetical protein